MGKYSAWCYDNGDNTIDANIWRFGRNPVDKKAALRAQPKVNVFELETYGGFDVSLQVGSKFLESVQATYPAVNGLPWYWMYGKQTPIDTDEKRTITKMDGNNAKPRLAFWEQTDDQKMAYFKLALKNLKWDLLEDGLIIDHTAIGCAWGENAASPTINFPDDASNNPVDSIFSYCSSMTWGGQAISPIKNTLGGEITQAVKGNPDSDGLYYESLSDFGTFHQAINFQLTSTEAEAYMMADKLAQTTKTLIFQIDKVGKDHYLEFTQECKLGALIPARDFERGIDVYQAMLFSEVPSIECLDYLDESEHYP